MKATIEEFRKTQEKLHRLWGTDQDFIDWVETCFDHPVMFCSVKPHGTSSSSSLPDPASANMFRSPNPEEIENNDPFLFGMLAFRKPLWTEPCDFLDMMVELAAIKDSEGNPPLGRFYNFDGFRGMPGNWYEKVLKGNFIEEIEKNHVAIESVFVRYGFSLANVCLTMTKMFDYFG